MPIYNEASSIENTVKEIFETLNGKIDFEFILSEMVTDGTKDY